MTSTSAPLSAPKKLLDGVPFPVLAALELVGAAALGTFVAVVWSVFATAWTWAVDPVVRLQPLSPRAIVIVAIPAFAMGWSFFLIRRAALKKRSNFIGAAFLCALAGSLVHRAVFLDDGFWDGDSLGLVGEIDTALQVIVKRFADHDAGFLAVNLGDGSLFMAVGTIAAACVLAAAAYSPIRRALS
jgi:hypothetical protein